MFNEDTIQYAIDSTQVVVAPRGKIATFGDTRFRFYLVSELMDRVDQVRVRTGHMHAVRPQLITPGHLQKLLLEGFSESAGGFADWIKLYAPQLVALKYGFRFSKTDISDQVHQGSIASVLGRLREEVDREEDPLSAVIQGVDEGWEICLLKFAADLIEDSSGGNFGDFKSRGLL